MSYDKLYTPLVVGCAFLLSATLFILSILKLRSKKNTTNRIAVICNTVSFVFELIFIVLFLTGVLSLFVEVVEGCPDEGTNRMLSASLAPAMTVCSHLEYYVSVWAIIVPVLTMLQLIISTVIWNIDRPAKKKKGNKPHSLYLLLGIVL